MGVSLDEIGDRLGRYEVRGVLGFGAMGRVYRAFDPALAREVAIKALVAAHGAPPSEAYRRFEREARLLATLNHPNIAAVYGWELIEGAPYLVLELVEGPTLAERLARGPLSVPETVSVARQLTLALEEAHRNAVVHRDLKPSNVKLAANGRVKVLDFGIATVVAAEEERDTPDGLATTGEGAVLGTVPYMSPEQIRAEPLDTRCDVWAFGCLLYEMLTGRRAFAGGSRAEVVAAILRDEPDWSALPQGLPAGLRRLLRRCLRRDAGERLQDIGDARIELSELDAEEREPRARGGGRLTAVLATAALLAAVLAIVLTRLGASAGPGPLAQLSLELPAGLTLAADYPAPFAISPDGSRLALLALREGKAQIHLRRLDRVETVAVPGTEGAWQPAFSADGRALVFFAERKLKSVPLAGGPAVVLAETSANTRGASVGPDGTVVFAPSQTSGLLRVDAAGGPPRALTQLDLAGGEGSHRWPQVLPGGEWVLFTCGVEGAPFDEADLDVVSLKTGERRRLLSGGAHGRYAAGRLFFARAGRLFTVPFDLGGMAVRGQPRVLIEGIHDDPRNGGAHFAVGESGPLVYGPAAPRATETYLAWVDAAGVLTRIGDTPRRFREPRLSPDGRRVAVRIGDEASSELWILDVERATLTRASETPAHHPIWTPDGHGITFASRQDGTWRILTLAASGAGPAVTVTSGPDRMYPNAWTPDGRSLVFQQRRAATGWDLRLVDVDAQGRGAGEPRDLAGTPSQESSATVSADGRFFAYDSDELDGIFGVYVAPLANPSARLRASGTIARWPRWGDGRRLYCWYPVGARPGESKFAEGLHRLEWPEGGAPASFVPLWSDPRRAAPLLQRLTVADYATFDVDVSERGPRFLVMETGASAGAPPLQRPVVVLNWQQEAGPLSAAP